MIMMPDTKFILSLYVFKLSFEREKSLEEPLTKMSYKEESVIKCQLLTTRPIESEVSKSFIYQTQEL